MGLLRGLLAGTRINFLGFQSVKGHKNSTDADSDLQDESIIPLLSNEMPLDKSQSVAPEIHAVRADEGASDSGSIREFKKPPWWSYIWVSTGVNLLSVLADVFRTMTH